MIEPDKPLDQIADGLLHYLRAKLDAPTIGYDSRLTQLQGGYETHTYRFRLSGTDHEWGAPLVLRLYPRHFGASNAVWESTVQNALADAGYPVARVYWF